MNVILSSAKISQKILWRQVWGLTTMLAAVLLGFNIYGIFQPRILSELGFSEWVGWLGVAQGLLGGVVEPVVGGLSDLILARWGSRLPQITMGATVAGLVFVVTALLLPAKLPVGLQGLFLVLMLVWLVAMIAIRGPIVALLRQFAPVEQLPIANELLLLVFGLVGAIGPFLGALLQSWGMSIAFAVGAILLVLGATTLQRTVAPPQRSSDLKITKTQVDHLVLGLVWLVGIGTSLEINTLLKLAPALLPTGWSVPVATSVLLLVAALAGQLLGRPVQRWGSIRAMQIGLGLLAIASGMLCLTIPSWLSWPLLLGYGVILALVLISMVPFALSSVSADHAGLSAGLFFGGSGLGTAIFSLLLRQWGDVTAEQGFGLMAIAFAIAVWSLAHCQRRLAVAIA